MTNLHILAKSVAKEPKTGGILGLLSYAILYRKCNIYRPDRTEVNQNPQALLVSMLVQKH